EAPGDIGGDGRREAGGARAGGARRGGGLRHLVPAPSAGPGRGGRHPAPGPPRRRSPGRGPERRQDAGRDVGRGQRVTAGHSLAGTTLRQRTAAAVADDRLRANVARAVDRFASHRVHALAELEDADGLRAAARAVRQRVLADLPALLERFADRVLDAGGHVCWAATATDARHYIAEVVARHGATRVAKSKSMATEEIALNAALEQAGAQVVETDLGEWIIQLADETP